MAGSALAKHPLSLGVLPRAARKAAPLGLAVASLALYLVVLASSGHQDLDAYLAAGRDLLAGRPLYAAFLHHPFPDPTLRPAYIYPPVFALLIAPLTWLPRMAAGWTWLLAMQAALVLSIAAVVRYLSPDPPIGRSRSGWGASRAEGGDEHGRERIRRCVTDRAQETTPGSAASAPEMPARFGGSGLGPTWAGRWVAVVLTFTFFPLHVDVAQGQTNLLVLALLVLGMVGILRGKTQAGAWLGVAAAIKLTPLLLLGWLLIERRWRAAGFLALGFAGTTALGALVRPADTVTFFGQVLPALARGTAYYSNQSLAGVLGRLLTTNPYTNPWLAVPWESVLAVGAGLALLGWWAFSRQGLDAPATAFSFLALVPLLSSVTWEHHLVVLLPLIWLSVGRLAGRGWPLPATALLGAAVVCLSVLPRWHPGPPFGSQTFRAAQTGDPLIVLTANALFGGTLILFLGSRWLLRSH